MFKNGDTCPVCGSGTLQSKIITENLEYKGQIKSVDNYAVLECHNCGDGIVEPETLKKTEKILRDFKHQVDGLLTSAEIKEIRDEFEMNQEEFANFLGITRVTLNRYENGRETQSKTIDKFIRLLAKEKTSLKFNIKIATSAGTIVTAGYKQKKNKYYEAQDGYDQAA